MHDSINTDSDKLFTFNFDLEQNLVILEVMIICKIFF